MGLSQATAAGAVICGAYFGDKMSPLSETTILVPKLVGVGSRPAAHSQHALTPPGAGNQPGHLLCDRARRSSGGANPDEAAPCSPAST
jgi:hypothetical protein